MHQTPTRRNFLKTAIAAAGACALPISQSSGDPLGNREWVVIRPEEYPYALRNPLKGFRPGIWNNPNSAYRHPYAGVAHNYIQWNEIENDESDGIEKITDFCNSEWEDAEKHNVKVIPRVYLDWDGSEGRQHWPADMENFDYSSGQFKTRLRRLIQRLGECWDNDPRVAWVQMGIIGKWGEHHSPSPTEEIQQLMGEEFTAAFQNKKVLVRHPWSEFTDFGFGGYWDSWAHWYQMNTQGAEIDNLNQTKAWWKDHIWEGECAYNWGDYEIQPGENPDATLREPEHREFLIDTIRNKHCTALGWVSSYDQDDPDVAAGAEEVQRTFGYRYVLNEVRYPAVLAPGEEFSVSFEITNTGSAPFYYDWPVEVSLLDPASKDVVWKDTFADCDIRSWLPGENYNKDTRAYDVSADANTVSGTFQAPSGLANGEYIVALAILDPAGMLPSARVAAKNYFNGGRHPIGLTGVGDPPSQYELSPDEFDDPAEDDSLRYSLMNAPSENP